MVIFYVIRLGLLFAVAFFLAFLSSPILTHFLYKYQCWKKTARTVAPDGSGTPLFNALHKDRETKTPRLGGLLIWVVTLLITLVLLVLSYCWPASIWSQLNFFSRSQTWIPLFTLVAAALLGLVDDILVVRGCGEAKKGGGIRFRHRAMLVVAIGLVGAWWFYSKLGWDTIHVPFVGDWVIGWWYIPLFIFVMLLSFSGSVIDGIDGLAGGVFTTIFAAYGGIAFARGQYDLAAFCAVLAGALLAFLWYNIPPARYYMSETGILALTSVLAVIVFLTDTVFIFPLIALVMMLDIASNVIQLFSKKFFHRKVFLIAPLHHHFEAKGWPAYKVTMRLWLVSGVAALLGLVIFLVDRSL